jgi:hypothetical protein
VRVLRSSLPGTSIAGHSPSRACADGVSRFPDAVLLSSDLLETPAPKHQRIITSLNACSKGGTSLSSEAFASFPSTPPLTSCLDWVGDLQMAGFSKPNDPCHPLRKHHRLSRHGLLIRSLRVKHSSHLELVTVSTSRGKKISP